MRRPLAWLSGGLPYTSSLLNTNFAPSRSDGLDAFQNQRCKSGSTANCATKLESQSDMGNILSRHERLPKPLLHSSERSEVGGAHFD